MSTDPNANQPAATQSSGTSLPAMPSLGANLPAVQPDASVPALPAGGDIDPFKYLTPTETQQAHQIAQTLNIHDTMAVTSFAVKPQKDMSSLSDPVLKMVSTKDTGPVGESLTNLMAQVKELNASSFAAQAEGWAAHLPVIGPLFSSVQRFISEYEKIGTKIDHIVVELESSKNTLNRDITLLDKLYDQNAIFFRQLLTYIAAGELKLQELRPQQVKLAEQARASNDPVLAQQASDLANGIARLERRVYDLKLTAMISLQTAPQLRLVQNADQSLVEKIQTSLLTTIPLWKNQVIIAITLFDQKKGLELQNAVTNTTNDLLLKNAEMLQMSTTAVARENERGIVEIETLHTVNQKLIDTIEDTLRIQSEGKQKRAEAEQQLEIMQKELQDKLTEVKAQ